MTKFLNFRKNKNEYSSENLQIFIAKKMLEWLKVFHYNFVGKENLVFIIISYPKFSKKKTNPFI